MPVLCVLIFNHSLNAVISQNMLYLFINPLLESPVMTIVPMLYVFTPVTSPVTFMVLDQIYRALLNAPHVLKADQL